MSFYICKGGKVTEEGARQILADGLVQLIPKETLPCQFPWDVYEGRGDISEFLRGRGCEVFVITQRRCGLEMAEQYCINGSQLPQ